MFRSPSSRKPRRRAPYDFAAFRGYRGPRFTPIPDEFLDHQLADLSSAETKVMLFLFRKTYGYRKSADRISLSQLERGTVAVDGRIIDRGTGLSRATIWRALKSLQEKGLIEVHRRTTEAGDADINYYRIREDLGEWPSGEDSSAVSHDPDNPHNPHNPDDSRDSDDSDNPHGLHDLHGSHNPPNLLSSHDPAEVEFSERGGGGEGTPLRSLGVWRGSEGQGRGWVKNETTVSSKVNHPTPTAHPPGSFAVKPTRLDVTRRDLTIEDFTLSALEQYATDFLQAIGYTKPARTKRERTRQILKSLLRDGYSLDEVQAACQIAVAAGARGPELIPHVIGYTPPVSVEVQEAEELAARTQEVGERLRRQAHQEQARWERLTAQFEALDEAQQEALLVAARRLNKVLAHRALDHPLLRAAAISLLEEAEPHTKGLAPGELQTRD